MKGRISRKELEKAFLERQSQECYEKMKSAGVGIAGLGGLGSNIAVMLTRAGVGRLKLVDFDRVDVTNLNRQAYMVEHIGRLKTEALKEMLLKINPYMKIETQSVKVDETNVDELFEDMDIVCEAFDAADAKAMLIGSLLSSDDRVKILSGSGMAGIDSGNHIRTERRMERLYVSGDQVSDVHEMGSLWASRVQLCAAHQAHMAVRLIHGYDEV